MYIPVDWVQFPAQSKRAIIAPYPRNLGSKLPVWGGGMQQREKERKVDERSRGETWLLIVWWKQTHARDELVGQETWRRDGMPIYFLYQIVDTTTVELQVPQRLTQSRCRTWDLNSKHSVLLVFLLRNSTVVGHLWERCYLPAGRTEYLLLNFLQGNMESKVLKYLPLSHHNMQD